MTHEQPDAELFLERGDAVADGAGGHAKLVASFLEAFVTLGGFKDTQRIERWQPAHLVPHCLGLVRACMSRI